MCCHLVYPPLFYFLPPQLSSCTIYLLDRDPGRDKKFPHLFFLLARCWSFCKHAFVSDLFVCIKTHPSSWRTKGKACRRVLGSAEWYSELSPMVCPTCMQSRRISRALTCNIVCKKISGEDARALKQAFIFVYFLISCACSYPKSPHTRAGTTQASGRTPLSESKLFQFVIISLVVSLFILCSWLPPLLLLLASYTYLGWLGLHVCQVVLHMYVYIYRWPRRRHIRCIVLEGHFRKRAL